MIKEKKGIRWFFYRRKRNWQLYLMILVPLAHLLLFKYYPMFGVQIAFKNFSPVKGIWGSTWVGFEHFIRFFQSYMFPRVMKNTLGISVYSILAGFPFPIILALSLNYLTSSKYRKIVQTTTYVPHLISTVVMVGILTQFLAQRNGIINNLLEPITGTRFNFLGKPEYFKTIYVWSGIWQGTGYSAIVYIAALAGIDPSLHEAAMIDGASKLKRMWHIDLPGILPTIIILLIMRTGNILSVGFEKTYLLQNSLNLSASEVISTYVYKTGIAASIPQYSFGAAIGFFESVIGMTLMLIVNKVSSTLTETSLW